MPHYEWRGSGVFRDARNDRTVAHGDVVELPERVAGNHDFVEVDPPEDPSGEATDDVDAQDQDANEESDDGEGQDYASMDYAELRQLAADADTDAINGKSSKDEIVAYFTEE